MPIMAGILEHLLQPQKKAIHDLRAMELETAKAILAEVFGIRLSEVDETIQNRFKDDSSQEAFHERTSHGRRSSGRANEAFPIYS
jgi:hypothetical protein